MGEQFVFQPAARSKSYGRLALFGPSGSGKTYTALLTAQELGGKIAVIDTEHGASDKYSDEFTFDIVVLEPPYHPDRFMNAIMAAQKAGYEVLIIDSISPEWDAIKEIVDQAGARMGGNKWAGWSVGTPLHNKFLQSILAARMHMICTMRARAEWAIEEVDGKKKPVKIGLDPMQRDGVEYEFDIVMSLNQQNDGTVSKSRCRDVPVGEIVAKPGKDFAGTYKKWLNKESRKKKGKAPDATATAAPADEATGGNGDAPTVFVPATGGTDAATSAEAPPSDPELAKTIEKSIAHLQKNHPDYAGLDGGTWKDRLTARCDEWFSTPYDDLNADQQEQLLQRVLVTIEQLDEAKAKATA